MKKGNKFVSIAAVCAFIVSCSNPVKKEFIENCRHENNEYKELVEQMRADLKEHKNAQDQQTMQYPLPVSSDKKKQSTGEAQLRDKINAQQDYVNTIVDRYSQVTDSISRMTDENDNLIATFSSEQPEHKIANEKWNANKTLINELKEKAELAMENMKEQEKELTNLFTQLPVPTAEKPEKKSKSKR